MAGDFEKIGLEAVLILRRWRDGVRDYLRNVSGMDQATEAAARRMTTAMASMGVTSEKELGRLLNMAMESGVGMDALARTTGLTADEITGLAKSAQEAATSQETLTKATTRADKAAKKQTTNIGRLIKRTALWIIGARTVFTVYNKVRRAIIEVVQEMVGQTREAEALSDAWDNFKRTAVASVASSDDLKTLMNDLTGLLVSTATRVKEYSASWAGYQEVTDQIASTGPFMTAFLEQQSDVTKAAIGAVATYADHIGLLGEKYKFAETFAAAYDRRLGQVNKNVQDAITGSEEYARALDRLIDASMRFDEQLSDNAERIREINDEYQVSQLGIQADFFRESQRINKEEQDSITEINRDALKDREDAARDFQDDLTKTQQRGTQRREQNEARHHLKMRQARERHNLTMFQSDRRFLASRERLVAEGDTLAIQELDERHAIEQAERKENFRLQQQQAEAMFRLQARIMEESNRKQVQELRRALGEQMALIEERRREAVDEARMQADEERAEAVFSAGQRLADAKAAQLEQLESEERAHQKRLEALGKFLRKFAEDNNLTLEQTIAIWQQKYGIGGPVDQVIRNAFQQYALYVQQFEGVVAGALSGVPLSPGRTRMSRRRGVPRHFPQGFQHGGAFDVSGPTQMSVGGRRAALGENFQRERVSIQPVRTTGNVSMSIQWKGGPIVVRGEGSLGGVQMQSMGDQITVAVMSRLEGVLNDMAFGGGIGGI